MELTLKLLCKCGKELNAEASHLSRGTIIEVEPCGDCINKSFQIGYAEAMQDDELEFQKEVAS